VAIDYEGRMAKMYNAGRSLGADALRMWAELAGRFVANGTEPVLDLGAGTGRFSAALANSLNAAIIALEPASSMQGQALGSTEDERVHPVSGSAEHLPLGDQSVRAIWASQVLHHVDLDHAASECRRVLVDYGTLLVRGIYADLENQWPLVEYFPELVAVDDAYFPTWSAMRGTLESAGFSLTDSEQVERKLPGGLSELYERTRHRADSGLALLDDSKFDKGLDALASAARCKPDLAVVETVDLFVFRTVDNRAI
jgi:ubiquinone/menaquinone biosynthesis C-methylase UbiE